MKTAIALLAVEHFILILFSFAFDAAFTVGTLPIVVTNSYGHTVGHFDATGMYCLIIIIKKKE